MFVNPIVTSRPEATTTWLDEGALAANAPVVSLPYECSSLVRSTPIVDAPVKSSAHSLVNLPSFAIKDFPIVGTALKFSGLAKDSQTVMNASQQNMISAAIASGQDKVVLPKKDITPFDGNDVTKYKSFMLNFERFIEARCPEAGDRLTYLEQYTRGKPLKLVKSCTHYDPATAYRKAKELLHKEYGNEFMVANAYIEKLYPKQMMDIVLELPYKLRERWRRMTKRLLEQHGSVNFGNLVDFVSSEVAVLKQPLFGKDEHLRTTVKRERIYGKDEHKEKPDSSRRVKKVSSASTESHESGKKFCVYCQRNDH
ncbi:hypothetical protein HAZT_HAZT006077 [Hyalella azteca]|uniref:Uncharacterized protein n=1 Tax=Hyalella azteca TaxID=294128 RepID=A0A6A0GWV7_HYAAZ|nr:hypothetical protein HAZT_HAZT006077 [Hyalella azteca]